MSIDMAQFHQVFFEESFEGLDAMESGLLNLDLGDFNVEDINTIFRAAHSIKGGSGTFGFTAVSDFTHVMETLLDEMRDGRRKITQPAVDVLLGSVDCLRDMLQSIQNGSEVDQADVAEHKLALDNELNNAVPNSPSVGKQTAKASTVLPADDVKQIAGWVIAFSPHLHLLKTGNEPVRMFRELASLGHLTTTVDLQGVPNLYDLDPEECHLSWKLEVSGDIPETEIDEIFDWVEDDCDLAKQPIYQTPSESTPFHGSPEIAISHAVSRVTKDVSSELASSEESEANAADRKNGKKEEIGRAHV